MIDRRTFLAAAAFLSLGAPGALATEPAIYRLAGTLTKENFQPFVELMTDSADGFVGLKLLVPSKGALTKTADGDGFSVDAEGSDARLVFQSGFRMDDRGHFVEGYYAVKDIGLQNGVRTVTIAPARSMDVEASGKPVMLVEIDKLAVKN